MKTKEIIFSWDEVVDMIEDYVHRKFPDTSAKIDDTNVEWQGGEDICLTVIMDTVFDIKGETK